MSSGENPADHPTPESIAMVAGFLALLAQGGSLAGQDLRGLKLRCPDLSGKDLTRTNLTGCVLAGATLTGASWEPPMPGLSLPSLGVSSKLTEPAFKAASCLAISRCATTCGSTNRVTLECSHHTRLAVG